MHNGYKIYFETLQTFGPTKRCKRTLMGCSWPDFRPKLEPLLNTYKLEHKVYNEKPFFNTCTDNLYSCI